MTRVAKYADLVTCVNAGSFVIFIAWLLSFKLFNTIHNGT